MFKNDVIQESDTAEHLVSNKSICDAFSNVIESAPTPALISLVGEYGSGKSMMLNRLRDDNFIEGSKWILFDAWKYPDRSSLWEGFILDFAENVGERKKYEDLIDGNTTQSKGAGVTAKVLDAANTALPGLSSVGKLLQSLFETQAIFRVSKLQELLTALINDQFKEADHLIIVVEDIDRSDDHGVHFLETFRHFLNQSEFKNSKVTVVAPIGNKASLINHSSYIKCFDISYAYNLEKVDLTEFVNRGLDIDKRDDQNRAIKDQIIKFLNGFVELQGPEFTIRKLKLLLRHANSRHSRFRLQGLEPDYRLDLCVEALRITPQQYPPTPDSNEEPVSMLDDIIEKNTHDGYYGQEVFDGCDPLFVDIIKDVIHAESDRSRDPSLDFLYINNDDFFGITERGLPYINSKYFV